MENFIFCAVIEPLTCQKFIVPFSFHGLHKIIDQIWNENTKMTGEKDLKELTIKNFTFFS